MRKLSLKIEKAIRAEIKTREALIKTLKQDELDYECDNSKKIKDLEDIVDHYVSMLLAVEEK